jgi:hypothetical protein
MGPPVRDYNAVSSTSSLVETWRPGDPMVRPLRIVNLSLIPLLFVVP